MVSSTKKVILFNSQSMKYSVFAFLFILSYLFSSCGGKNTKPTATSTNLDSLLLIQPNNVDLLVKRGNLMLDSFLLKYNKKYFEVAKPDAAKAFRLDSSRLECCMRTFFPMIQTVL